MNVMSPRPIIEVKDHRKAYPVGDEVVVALKRINLNIMHGEVCCIFGTSGSGKSTLLNQLAGMEKPTRGVVLIGGVPISRLSEQKMAAFRQQHIGFVFQSYNLLPNLTATENVALPLMFRGVPKAAREQAARKLLCRVGLSHRLDHFPAQMSGGQQQRAGIYMAVLDDELCRAKPTEAHTGSAKVTMSSRRESLQYRYHLYLEMNKGKSPAELLSQTSQMEAQLLSAQDEISQHEVLGADRSAALDALDKLVIIAAKDCGVDASLFEKQESKGKGHYYEAQLDGYTVYLELEAAFGAHPSAILYQRADGSNDLQLMKAYDLT